MTPILMWLRMSPMSALVVTLTVPPRGPTAVRSLVTVGSQRYGVTLKVQADGALAGGGGIDATCARAVSGTAAMAQRAAAASLVVWRIRPFLSIRRSRR